MRIRLHADYECYPLWIEKEDGLSNVEPSTLSLVPSPLAERITRWGEEYDKTYKPDDPIESGFPAPDEERAFDATGETLWQELKETLGDEHEVAYYSVLRGWMGR